VGTRDTHAFGMSGSPKDAASIVRWLRDAPTRQLLFLQPEIVHGDPILTAARILARDGKLE
jgi:hypothetical protein